MRRLLQRFIKSAAGERASDLRVSLSGGSLVLANLELNLDALLGRLPLRVERAYARQLRVTVPWTALATQPIQARSGRRPCCSLCHRALPRQWHLAWQAHLLQPASPCTAPYTCMIRLHTALPSASLPARAYVWELGCGCMAVNLACHTQWLPCSAGVSRKSRNGIW